MKSTLTGDILTVDCSMTLYAVSLCFAKVSGQKMKLFATLILKKVLHVGGGGCQPGVLFNVLDNFFRQWRPSSVAGFDNLRSEVKYIFQFVRGNIQTCHSFVPVRVAPLLDRGKADVITSSMCHWRIYGHQSSNIAYFRA